MVAIPRPPTLKDAIESFIDSTIQYQALANVHRVLRAGSGETPVTYSKNVSNGMHDEAGNIRSREFFMHDLRQRYVDHLRDYVTYEERNVFGDHAPRRDEEKIPTLMQSATLNRRRAVNEAMQIEYLYAYQALELQPGDRKVKARYDATLKAFQQHQTGIIDANTEASLDCQHSYDEYKQQVKCEYDIAHLPFPTKEEWEERLLRHSHRRSGLDANADGVTTAEEAAAFARRIEHALQTAHYTLPPMQEQASRTLQAAKYFAHVPGDGVSKNKNGFDGFGANHILALQGLLPVENNRQIAHDLHKALVQYNTAHEAQERYHWKHAQDLKAWDRGYAKYLQSLTAEERLLEMAANPAYAPIQVELGPEAPIPAVPVRKPILPRAK